MALFIAWCERNISLIIQIFTKGHLSKNILNFLEILFNNEESDNNVFSTLFKGL